MALGALAPVTALLWLLFGCDAGEGASRAASSRAAPSAADGVSWRPTAPPSAPLRVAVITDIEGVIEPCGCTVSSAGGIDRLGAAVTALRAAPGALVLAASGDLLLAPESQAASGKRHRGALDIQAAVKADALTWFLSRLGLDVLRPGPSDLARAGSRLRETVRGGRPRMVGAGTGPEGVELEPIQVASAGQYQVAFLSDAAVNVGADASQLSVADLRIAFAHGPESAMAPPNMTDGVDVLVRSGLQIPTGFARQRDSRIEVYAGHHAQELWILEVWFGEKRGAGWELTSDAGAGAGKRNLIRARPLRLSASAPADPAARQFMNRVFERLDRSQRALAQVEPTPAAHTKLKSRYVGSRTCAACHTAAFFWWQQTPHARAYKTLLERQRGLDLDCIGCHVTGFDQPGGARLGQLQELSSVGCESCHGPGGAHADNPSVRSGALRRDVPEATCLTCHDAEHSDAFDYASKRGLLLQPGHGR